MPFVPTFATAADARAALPGDVRLQRMLATFVGVAGLALCVAALVGWAIRQPALALRGIRIVSADAARPLQHQHEAAIRAVVTPKLPASFFRIDLAAAKAAFEQVPWVRRAVVSRRWPLALGVALEEHQPAAFWAAEHGDDDRLLNTQGEVFQANVADLDDDLPTLSGPEGTAPTVLAMWRRLATVVEPLGLGAVDTLVLSPQGSWTAHFERGAHVELGRGSDDEVLARVADFARTLPQVQTGYGRALLAADLRHAGGYAVRLQGVATAASAPPPVRVAAAPRAATAAASSPATGPAAARPSAPRTAH